MNNGVLRASALGWLLCASSVAQSAVSIGGFVPFVGIGLTKEFETFDSDPTGTFFIADPSYSWGSPALGPGSAAYFDLALLDTGAATHILTQTSASAAGFSIQAEGLRGTNFQTIGGATGTVQLRINDPLGVYAAGLGDRAGDGAALTMDTLTMRGQTSVATLEGDANWKLPNILGLPMAAHHAIVIRNNDPQIFQYQGRTVRTPQVDFVDLGTGNQQDILRRTNLKLRPGTSFISGPLYVQNLDILGGNLNFHDNPLSPSVVENGALFVEVDMSNGAREFQDKEFLFDTGADFTVISQLTAARLGYDALLDTPDFFLEVEGSGGVSSGVPGIIIDELNIDTIGGSFTLTDVPVAVLDVTNPNDPGNIIDGIIGMHLFNDRNLVIDANPSVGQGGTGPSLYISDPVTQDRVWATSAASGTWATPGNWNVPGLPDVKWDATVANSSGSNQVAVVAANSTVYRMTVSGTPTAEMTVQINSGVTLTTYGETLIDAEGRIELQGGKLDTQFVNIDGGTLTGVGEVFAGTGPVTSPVRNLSGRIEPGVPVGLLTLQGDLSNQADGTLAFELGGLTAITQYDRLAVDRFAFLDGILEVSLIDLGGRLFNPSVGNTFTILTAGEEVFGTFETLLLPAGFTWDVIYNPTSVVLAVTGLGLQGDFNGNGIVDAADYAVWRDTLGDATNYDLWKSNFGKPSGIGTGAEVPEPAGWIAAIIAVVIGALSRKRRACRRAAYLPQ